MLINALLFQAGWFACVLGTPWIAVAVLATHLLRSQTPGRETRLVLAIAGLGSLLDSLLMHAGVLDFNNASVWVPPWLTLLWALLGCTLNHCLAWTARPWWRASLLGAVGGPLSYYAGAQLAGVRLPLGLWPSLLILGVIWAAVLPLLHEMARRMRT